MLKIGILGDLPFEFNWGSKYHASYIIFGGTAKYSKQTTYIDEATGELMELKPAKKSSKTSFKIQYK
jgi:hypothetical protein